MAEEDEFGENLAEKIDDNTLQTMAAELYGHYDADIRSRKDWMVDLRQRLEAAGPEVRGAQ